MARMYKFALPRLLFVMLIATGAAVSRGTYHKYFDELRVPIIENTPEEADLTEWLAEAIRVCAWS